MRLVAQPAWFGARGIDCVTPINEAFADWLVANHFDYVSRYLGSLSKTEIGIIVSRGLAFFPVCYAGQRDPRPHAAALGSLLIPPTVTVWNDLESVPTEGNADIKAKHVINELDAWAKGIRGPKGDQWDPGIYIANDPLLTSVEMGHLLIDRYWQGAAKIVDRTGRLAEPTLETGPIGWCGKQIVPGNITRWRGKPTPAPIDVDFVYEDFRGRVPTWCVGVP